MIGIGIEVIVVPQNLRSGDRNCLWCFGGDGVPKHESRKLTWLGGAAILCCVCVVEVIVVKSTASTLTSRKLDET